MNFVLARHIKKNYNNKNFLNSISLKDANEKGVSFDKFNS
jgi:hypothetical protein